MLKSLRFWSLLFGLAFILVGIAGFLPEFTTGDMLFGLFMVSLIHNSVHIITGIIFILAATRTDLAKHVFRLFGFIYLIVAIMGLARNGDLFLMQVNMADNILHLSIAVVAFFFGFVFNSKKAY